MKPHLALETGRLLLRPFVHDDAPRVQSLAGARKIADMTLNIPHPYPDGAAETWIDSHSADLDTCEAIHCAIVSRQDERLIGAVALLNIDRHASRAELGYWIGVPFWNQGFATEASRALVGFGFERLGLHRIHAQHFKRNPASGRVLTKVGMRPEGCLRGHARKGERYEDLVQYGVLRSEFSLRGLPRREDP
jgi:RimJ/RimL family protein N-acetyltransferase